MAEAIARPPSLRAFLDAGCDITTLPGWECLAEDVVLLANAEPAMRARGARQLRDLVEGWLSGRLPESTPVDQPAVTRYAWEAECIEDGGLADRLEGALPPDKRAELFLIRLEILWSEEQS